MNNRPPPKARICYKKDFNALFKSGRRFRGECIDAVIAKSENDLNTPRIGISTPARVGKAVVRNRMRRLIREAFRLSYSQINKNVDMVIIVKKGSVKTPFKNIESDFSRLLKAARLL